MTATIHERVCALMRDGKARTVDEVAEVIGSPRPVIYKVLAKLETEESLSVLRVPGFRPRLYSWVP